MCAECAGGLVTASERWIGYCCECEERLQAEALGRLL